MTILQFFVVTVFLAQSAIAADFPIVVKGSDEASFHLQLPLKNIKKDPEKYDVVVVGGGPSGLISALFLSDAGKKVLVIEKEKSFGGLAQGDVSPNGWQYATGAAYFTYANTEQDIILEHIGFPEYRQKQLIRDPIDSYFWNGKLYEDVWKTESLKELPASFEVFKYEMMKSQEMSEIPDLPFEESDDFSLDRITAEKWINDMPRRISQREEPAAQEIYSRFLLDKRIYRAAPMQDVIDFLALYCRSALGSHPRQVSAAVFSNFYYSEMEARYATTTGTGGIAKKIVETLQSRANLVTLKEGAQAVQIKNSLKRPVVTYVQNGEGYHAFADYVVYSAPLKYASIIRNLRELAPEKAKVIDQMIYSNYTIHSLFVKGHPYRASFDTWVRASDYSENDFADLILGRWMDPTINGYEGMRDFRVDPVDPDNILSLYHPLSLDGVGNGYTTEQAIQTAEHAVKRFKEIFSSYFMDRWGTLIDIKKVETHRWPASIHIVTPGHFELNSKILRKPIGKVYFANNNIGAPSLEEAFFRGHCAANNILNRMQPDFRQESWTNCPLDQ